MPQIVLSAWTGNKVKKTIFIEGFVPPSLAYGANLTYVPMWLLSREAPSRAVHGSRICLRGRERPATNGLAGPAVRPEERNPRCPPCACHPRLRKSDGCGAKACTAPVPAHLQIRMADPSARSLSTT